MKKGWWIVIAIIAILVLIAAFIIIKNINTVECDASALVGSKNACVLPAPYDSPAPNVRFGLFGKYFGVV